MGIPRLFLWGVAACLIIIVLIVIVFGDNADKKPQSPQNICEIEFIHIPPHGTFDDLRGKVKIIGDPIEYWIAVYIYVDSNSCRGWWNKPTHENPVTYLGSDGSFTCDITTGGVDEYAIKITAFLIPVNYNPPLVSGSLFLPQEIYQDALAVKSITRSP